MTGIYGPSNEDIFREKQLDDYLDGDEDELPRLYRDYYDWLDDAELWEEIEEKSNYERKD